MKKWWLLTIMLLASAQIWAQSGRKLYVDAPRVVMTGESFQVKYILKNPDSKNPRFIPPQDVQGLNSYGMSSYSSSQSSVAIVNGRLKSTTTYTITWILTYVADKPGTYTIPPAKVVDGNSTLTSSAVTITVEGEANNNLPKPKTPVVTNDQDKNVVIPSQNSKLFLRLWSSKKDVYLGEPIYVYARLYSAYRLSIDDMEPAKYQGFWVQDIKMPSRIQAEQVVINGRQYLAATVDKKLIFPQQAGKLRITPYKISCTIYDNWGFPYGQKDIVSNPLVINVKALPQEGQPSTFSGAVGNFKIDIVPPKGDISVDQAITIKLIISGTGNFGLFDIPQLKVPNSFEALEPKTIPHYEATPDGLSGKVEKQFIYIPRSSGNFEIPPVEFSFFNPNTGKYEVVRTSAIKLSVNGSSDTASASGGYTVYKTDVTQIGSDINYIFTSPFKLTRHNTYFAGSLWHYLAYIIAILFFAVIVYLRRQQIKEMADIRRYRARQAGKVSARRLKTALKYMRSGKKDEFYQEIAQALWQYLSDKLGIDAALLTRDAVREKLAEKGVDTSVIDEVIKILDESEFARYAQSAGDVSMETLYSRTRKIIDKLETLI